MKKVTFDQKQKQKHLKLYNKEFETKTRKWVSSTLTD